MKPSPDTLLSKAEGTIPEQPFTGEQSGFFAKTYFSGPPIYERLWSNEAIHHLLVNRSSGVVIHRNEASEPTVRTPDRGLRAALAVTDQRVLFVVGQTDGDWSEEIRASYLTDATLKSRVFSTEMVVETDSESYTFSIKKRDLSRAGDAMRYIREHLVPLRSSANPPTRKGEDPTDLDTSTTDEKQIHPAPDTDSANEHLIPDEHENDATPERPVEPFIVDSSEIADETRETLRTALLRLQGTDTRTDDIKDAITALESSEEELRQVADSQGVATERVRQTIDRVEDRLELLNEILTAITEAERKFAIVEHGPDIRTDQFEALRASIDEALEAAEQLGRSQPELERYLDRLPSIEAEAETESHREKNSKRDQGEASGKEVTSASGGTKSVNDETDTDSMNEGSFTGDRPDGSGDGSTPSEKSSQPSRADLIAELRRVGEQVNTTVRPTHVRRKGRYRGTTFLKEFGDWETALDTAFSDREEAEDEGASLSADSEDEDMSASPETEDVAGSDPTVDEPTPDEFVATIERVAQDLEKRPTMSEFDAHVEYDSSDVYDHFNGWEEAVDAADIDFASRQKLLSELHRLESQLGFVPLSSHVDDQSQFSAYDYRLEFGSVDAALEKAGLDPEIHAMEILREVVANTDGKPRMADFADASPYSQSIIYKYFDSWDDAIAAARSEVESGRTSGGTGDEPEATTVDQEPERNELSERYELLRNLRTLVTAVIDACEAGREQDDQMVGWALTIEEFWDDGPTGGESYGVQQNERNPFSMREYRRTFGNGTRVTEFGHVTAVPPCPSVGGLLAPLLDDDPSTYYLPVDPDTGAPLPVIVESQDELRRARGMLQRLPPEPEAVTRTEQPDEDRTDTHEGSGPSCTSERPSDEVLNVSGVTESIARSLSEAGYATREDLRRASMEELTSVDGINEQVVMRIKLDVGE